MNIQAEKFLSKNDIERIAQPIVEMYKLACVPQYRMCYNVDPMQLADVLDFKIQYSYLSQDGSILGETASTPIWTTIIDSALGETYYYLDGKTILIDKRLLNNPRIVGRKNFTIAHELAHLILNNRYPEMYGSQFRTLCAYRKTSQNRKEISDWHEWQADTLAAALLLPPDALDEAMFMFCLGSKMKVLSRKYSQHNYENFCRMAEFLQVSKTTLAYRMEQLGLLERNYLIKEAQQRRGSIRV